ncbi:MAG: OPT/YSL family transporter [bacterium]|nr:OPT/YSL family transporter [bacterium]
MSDPTQNMTVEERDREWYAHVYQKDVPQLTARAVVSGMLFGGLMSLSNLYVGLKSGWGLGVDIVAVILIFSIFKGLKGAGIVRRDFGMMENTIMMTVAVAASWISSAGLVSAVPALSMLTGYEFVWWQLAILIGSILYLGLFMAIPLKRQMIQVDNLRFPGNIPTGETLKAMYSKGTEAVSKAKALGIAGFAGIIIAGLRDGLGWIPAQLSLPISLARVSMSKLTMTFEPSLIFIGIGALFGIKIGLSMLAGLILNYGILAPNLINDKIIKHPAPQVQAATLLTAPLVIQPGQSITVTLEEANVSPELAAGSSKNTYRYTWYQQKSYANNDELVKDFNAQYLANNEPNPFYGVISVRDTISKANGAGAKTLFFEASKATFWEAKLAIDKEQSSPQIIAAMGFEPGQSRTQVVGGFRNISAWSLWPGATILVVGGLLALAFQWRTLGRTFASIFSSFGRRTNGEKTGVLDDIEIPMGWFAPGFIVTGIMCILALTMMFGSFGVHWYMGLIAVLLTFILAAVASRAGAEVGINPIGALGKVTQLTFGAISAGNVTANLMTAGITAGAAASCSDTIGNLKVGHMVGANPRKQFIAQLFGVLAGALLAVPAYFILVPDVSVLGGDKFPAPSALVWMGVAKVLAQGIRTLPQSAVIAMAIAFILAVVIVVAEKIFPKIKPYTPNPTALGIAMTIPAYTSFAMFLGALIAWILEKRAPKANDMYTIPTASGLIGGESIMGVAIAALIAFGIL